MKASLHLQLSQQLTLTPQLQQAIRLLQLSTIELQQEIAQAIENNPFLELEEIQAPYQESKSKIELSTDELERDDKEVDSADLSIHQSWDQLYSPSSSNHMSDDEGVNLENIYACTEDLRSHLMWQMRLTTLSDNDKKIATAIIDSINDNGYLSTTIDDITEGLQRQEPELGIEKDEVLAVLHLIQRFDPIGVAASNIQECLNIQLTALSDEIPWKKQAIQLVSHHLDLLGQKNYPSLMKLLNLNKDQLQLTIKLIQTLHPNPGSLISPSKTEYIIPDVIVGKKQNRWVAELNQMAIPQIKINQQYLSLISKASSKSDSTFLKNNLQEARWLIKSLQSRNQTLLRVANFIVQYQQDFLEHGEVAMKPLVLSKIAESLDMHESTISRVTTQKYMYTPRGIYELKYFFSSYVQTASGGEASATAIRAFIKQIVADENRTNPLSDKQIADLLSNYGIKIARRTIAKYREAIGIPPSHERKSIFAESRN